MNWIIIRTDFRKEAYVADAIRRTGFDAWHPVQVIACRPASARRIMAKTQLRAYREVSLIPRRVFAAVPHWGLLQGELDHIRYRADVERNAALDPVSVPPAEIAAFKAAIDAENTASLALATKASRKQKARWKSLHDALIEMIEQAKGQLERAA